MTLPNSHRTCHRCDYVGDVEAFWVKDASGEFIKSYRQTIPLDKLRLGSEAAAKYAYKPNKEVCPKCGYDPESIGYFDSSKTTEITMEFFRRRDARKRAEQARVQGNGCLLVLGLCCVASLWFLC